MASADWTSLPPELIDRIAGYFLETNDVDRYMDFRAVCSAWRSATDDPRNSSDDRFRPRNWAVIDEVFESDSRLLVNTATGRVLRKDLPLLRRYYVVATTPGGFFVLAEKSPPHPGRVLNPFTGHLIRFAAPMPSERGMSVTAAAVVGSSPSLILFCDEGHKLYNADRPDSECLDGYGDNLTYPFLRIGLLASIYGCFKQRCDKIPKIIFPLMKSFTVHPSELLSPHPYSYGGRKHTNRCFLVESAGEILIIFKLQQPVEVFRMDTGSDELKSTRSIGSRAIFLGCHGCLSVDAKKFPSIDANCIYYIKGRCDRPDVYVYSLRDDKEERVSAGINDIDHILSLHAVPPFTIIQLLSSYTTDFRECDIESEQSFLDLDADD